MTQELYNSKQSVTQNLPPDKKTLVLLVLFFLYVKYFFSDSKGQKILLCWEIMRLFSI